MAPSLMLGTESSASLLQNPEMSDQAKYACIVKNKDGENSQSLNLNFD